MPDHAADPDLEPDPKFEFDSAAEPVPRHLPDYDLDPEPELEIHPEHEIEAELRFQRDSRSESDGDADADAESDFDAEPRHFGAGASPFTRSNKYRQALEVLGHARETLVDALADEILDNADEFRQGGFFLNEFLDIKGPRMHFLGIMAGYLEQAADTLDERRHAEAEAEAAAQQTRRRRRRSRTGGVETRHPSERPSDD